MIICLIQITALKSKHFFAEIFSSYICHSLYNSAAGSWNVDRNVIFTCLSNLISNLHQSTPFLHAVLIIRHWDIFILHQGNSKECANSKNCVFYLSGIVPVQGVGWHLVAKRIPFVPVVWTDPQSKRNNQQQKGAKLKLHVVKCLFKYCTSAC